MAKNKYFLLLIFLILFLSFGAGFVHAALEVKDYPSVFGLVKITENSSLPEFIAYWFGLLIYIAGAISLISFVVGAVGLINHSVEAHGDAKDRMKGAILGLVLTLASFLILKTINPMLTTPTLTPLPATSGIFYYNVGTQERGPVAMQVSDNTNRPVGFDSLLYDCTGKGEGSGGTGPVLLVWEFLNTGLETDNDLSQVHVARMNCGNVEDIGSFGSLSMAYETQGVYYCYGGCGGDNMCSSYMSKANTGGQDSIPSPFAGNLGGVRILGNYGVIFHKEAGLLRGGECSLPIINEGQDSKCEPVDMPVSAINIFKYNTANSATPVGNGVTFYSEPFGSDVGTQKRGEGFCEITNNKIGNNFKVKAEKLIFGEDNSPYSCNYAKNTITLYKNKYKTLKDRPKSMYIKGNYLVALFGGGANDSSYCQVFSKNAYNLNVQPFMATGHSVGDIYIIPIK